MIVAFSGIDGAGKSTQIELLQKYYSEKNQESIVIWARGGYTSGMKWLKNTLRKSKVKSIPATGGKSKDRDQAFKNPKVRKIWLTLAILDLLRIYGIQVRWFQLRGKHVIFDRFLEDTLMDFNLNFPQENLGNWWLWKLLKKLSVSPQVHYVLLIPVEESQRRSVLKNEPFPDSAEVLISRIDFYKSLIQASSKYVYIDCMNKIDIVFNQIKESIK